MFEKFGGSVTNGESYELRGAKKSWNRLEAGEESESESIVMFGHMERLDEYRMAGSVLMPKVDYGYMIDRD